MTKLTATEIKGIIEERGSNVFDVIIDVPSNIFSRSEKEQSNIVSKELFGFSIKSNILKMIMFNGASKSPNKMNVKSTLEFSDASLEELAHLETLIAESKENAVTLIKPLTAAEAIELGEKGVFSFILAVPFGIVRAGEFEQRRYISNSIIEGIQIKGFTTSAHSYDSGVTTSSRGIYMHVLVPDFQEYVEKAAMLKDTEESIYESLEKRGERLSVPLESSDIEDMIRSLRDNLIEEGEDEDISILELERFYLIEVDYDSLVSMDGEDTYYHIRNSILLSETLENVEVESLSHEAIGYNPISNKLIIEVLIYLTLTK